MRERIATWGLSRWDGLVALVLVTILAALGSAALLERGGGASPRDGFEIRSLAGVRVVSAADTTIRIPGPAGGLTLVVHEGRARVVEAGCPTKRCLRMGPIWRACDPPIQCIPNAVSIRAVGRGGTGRRLDGVTG